MSATTLVVPYVTKWSAEQELPSQIVERSNGIGIAYADEIIGDRDRRGVLWQRTPSLPQQGKPQFGQVHSGRQRRTMRKLLCQVCGEPIEPAPDGSIMWLLKDHRADWPGWPDRMGVTEPPTCPPCAHTAARLCPALRQGHVIVRARHFPIAGVYGLRYQPGQPPRAESVGLVSFDDPDIRWTLAASLVRRLGGCVVEKLSS